MQHTDNLDRGIPHAIKDNVPVYGDRTNAWKQLIAGSPGMRPLSECLACPIDGTKLLVSNVRRRFAGYIVPNGEEIVFGVRRPIDRELTPWHIGRGRG